MVGMNKLQLRVNHPEAEIIRDALLAFTGQAAAPVKLDEVRRLGLWVTWRIAQYWPAPADPADAWRERIEQDTPAEWDGETVRNNL